jgi:hypothetical protein
MRRVITGVEMPSFLAALARDLCSQTVQKAFKASIFIISLLAIMNSVL